MNELIVGPWPTLSIGTLHLPSYQILVSLMFTGLILWAHHRADQKFLSISTTVDVFLISLLTGSIGARLMHIFYEAPTYYYNHPLEVFYVWQGGFVYWGGFLGAILGGWATLKYKSESFSQWLDFFTPIVSLGYALGRCVCFLVGCCYGKVCDLPWAYGFTQVHLATGERLISYRHPTQLYAALLEMFNLVFILWLEKSGRWQKKSGLLFITWLFIHSCCRLIVEIFRDDDRGEIIWELSISSWISIAFILGTKFIYFKKFKIKNP